MQVTSFWRPGQPKPDGGDANVRAVGSGEQSAESAREEADAHGNEHKQTQTSKGKNMKGRSVPSGGRNGQRHGLMRRTEKPSGTRKSTGRPAASGKASAAVGSASLLALKASMDSTVRHRAQERTHLRAMAHATVGFDAFPSAST